MTNLFQSQPGFLVLMIAFIWILDNSCDVMQWMPLVEFVEQQLVQEDSMFKKIIDISTACLCKSYCGLSAHQIVSKFDGKSSFLYYNAIDKEDNS